jgi:hypothetical protein
MEVNHSVESRRDDDNQQLEIMYWQVSVYTIRSTAETDWKDCYTQVKYSRIGFPKRLVRKL